MFLFPILMCSVFYRKLQDARVGGGINFWRFLVLECLSFWNGLHDPGARTLLHLVLPLPIPLERAEDWRRREALPALSFLQQIWPPAKVSLVGMTYIVLLGEFYLQYTN